MFALFVANDTSLKSGFSRPLLVGTTLRGAARKPDNSCCQRRETLASLSASHVTPCLWNIRTQRGRGCPDQSSQQGDLSGVCPLIDGRSRPHVQQRIVLMAGRRENMVTCTEAGPASSWQTVRRGFTRQPESPNVHI